MRGTRTAATVVYTWSLGGADPIPVIKGRAVYWQQKHDKFVFPTSLQRSLTTQMFVLCKCVYVYIISSVQDVSTISTSYSSRTRTSFWFIFMESNSYLYLLRLYRWTCHYPGYRASDILHSWRYKSGFVGTADISRSMRPRNIPTNMLKDLKKIYILTNTNHWN